MADKIIRNKYGEAVLIRPDKQSPDAVSASLNQLVTPLQIANAFLEENKERMGLEPSLMAESGDVVSSLPGDKPSLSFQHEKNVPGGKIVVYEQQVGTLPVFGARVGVQIEMVEGHIVSAQSSAHGEIDLRNPDAQLDAEADERKLTKTALKRMIGINLANITEGRIPRQLVYRYEPEEREEYHEEGAGCFGGHPNDPRPTLPEVPKEIDAGKHYIVNEVLFQASLTKDQAPVNWRALVEPESGAVLYIRALVACATGMVFALDPQTQGGATVTGASGNAVLNPFRSSVTLEGLMPSTPQELHGEFVKVMDTAGAPNIDPPTVPSISGAFNYDVATDDFSAVNAYYHCDRMFRLMQSYGFDVTNYFGGTTFPVPVDHRSLGNSVNAQAPGNATGDGLLEFRFALLQAGQPVGMATSNRVAWHEMGHALLWNHVGSPNFGFAHSAGDALAAILNDPETQEPDRFDTFPWVQQATNLNRRHDRTIAGGWAWFGPEYNTQYGGEQILSSTLFRFYRSIGGDATATRTRRRAADMSAYLILKAISLLSSTTPFPEIYEDALESSDRMTQDFQGWPGGALHKVIRWSFEKQGLFHPDAVPGIPGTVSSEGDPPEVDIYIDDGRQGEYQYLANHWSCQDIWVRRADDGGLAHQTPIVGQTNFMYVRVKNRGLKPAENVSVDGYHALPGAGLSFPDDWMDMSPATVSASSPIPPGGEAVVGPFKFIPGQVGHESLFAIARADEDEGNDTVVNSTIPESRFVPFDNNVAQRNVHPVIADDRMLLAAFESHPIWLRNPYRETARCTVSIKMPKFLTHLGWRMRVASPGGLKFEIAPKQTREFVMEIESGEHIPPEVAKRAIAENKATIEIVVRLDDEISGGMTYPLTLPVADGEERRDDMNIVLRGEQARRALTVLSEAGIVDDDPGTGELQLSVETRRRPV